LLGQISFGRGRPVLKRALGILALGLLIAPASALADMYKCVDANGKTTYSDKSQPGCKLVDIHGQQPIGGSLQNRGGSTSADEAAFRRRQIQREREDDQEKKSLAERCGALRGELARLSSGRRIIEKVTPSGERVYLDDQVRDQRVAQLNDELKGCP
jgi:hypothetical protein